LQITSTATLPGASGLPRNSTASALTGPGGEVRLWPL